MIKDTEYNTKLRDDADFKHLPDRSKSLIGSTHPKLAMITVGYLDGPIEADKTFIIIPFDNVEIAVSPILDLQALDKQSELFIKSKFLLKKYTKNFNISRTPKEHTTIDSNEIWTEGECLLVRYSSLDRLKELVKNRSV